MSASRDSLERRALVALLATAAVAAIAALRFGLARAISAPLGALVVAPAAAVIGTLVLARMRAGLTLASFTAQLALCALWVLAGSVLLDLPGRFHEAADLHRHTIALVPPSERVPADTGPDLPFLEAIRDRLPRDGRTLVLTESLPLPDLEVILYPLRDGPNLALKVNPHPDVVAQLEQRPAEAGTVPTAHLIELLRASGFLVPWRSLDDAPFRAYLEGFDAIAGMNVSLPLEQLSGFDVALVFDPRRKLLLKRARGS